MTFLSQPEYLNGQYKDSSNLDARIALHVRFSQNRQGWMPWVFEQLDLPHECRVLELGCGPGTLWSENRARMQPGWKLILSDASAGMVATARRALPGASPQPGYAQIDAMRLPFAQGAFDAVIANFMLYHVGDRFSALAEIRRVLRPGGCFYAATVGEAHMREIDELSRRFDPALDDYNGRQIGFSLENGAQELSGYFHPAEMRRYPDGLVVTEAEPLVAYIVSGTRAPIAADRRAEFQAFIDAEIKRQGGAIRITKDSGIFVAIR